MSPLKKKYYLCRSRYRAEDAPKVAKLLREYVELAKTEAGCLYYEIYEDSNEPGVFYMWDGWESQEASDAHVKHPNMKVNAEELQNLVVEPPVLITLKFAGKGE